MKKKSIMNLEYKWEVLLVYLIGILGFIFSFMKDKEVDKEVKEQYNQAGLIFLIDIVINIVSRVLINAAGMLYVAYILSIVQLVLGIFAIVAIVKAFKGESYHIPVIYDLSKSIWK